MKLPIEEIAAINAELQINLPAMSSGARVYIASPLSAPTPAEIEHNMEKAEFAVEYLRRKYPQYRFLAPHTFFPRFLDDNVPKEREFGMKCGLKALSFCSAMLLFGNYVSSGMSAEIKEALRLRIPVFCADNLRPRVEEIIKSYRSETFERLRETINACKNMDAHEYPLRELCPELVCADDRPACWGGWNNAIAKWDAECEVCEAWMLNQKPMTMEASPE